MTAQRDWTEQEALRARPLFQVDSGLIASAPHRVADELGAARLSVLTLRPGPWTPPPTTDAFAFEVVSGILAHETRLPGEQAQELVGPGDIVLTSEGESEVSSVPWAGAWDVLARSEVALFDERFLRTAGRAPHVLLEFARRAASRAERNLIQLAIAGVHPIERRIELLLWHLADQWGVRRRAGVEIPVPLKQRTLAALSATERTTVCRVLIELVNDGKLEKLPGWQVRLTGPPPTDALLELAVEQLELSRQG